MKIRWSTGKIARPPAFLYKQLKMSAKDNISVTTGGFILADNKHLSIKQ